jgi:3-dehydroquinate dehydratase-2
MVSEGGNLKLLLINGANLNMLGLREPEKYGNTSLADIENSVINRGKELGADVDVWQSNHEGDIVDKIQSAKGKYDGILINAGGYTHTSVVIRDAISSVQIPTVEIHMTNIHAREEFRHTSLLSGVCVAQVVGFKEQSYLLALEGLIKTLK